jgi:hypothetical protein
MQKEQKAILNELKTTILNELEYARYVRREGNSVKFFAGTHKAFFMAADNTDKPSFTCQFPKQQQARGWHPVGVEMDLTSYKQYIDNLAIPGLTTEITNTTGFGGKRFPQIVATLAV